MTPKRTKTVVLKPCPFCGCKPSFDQGWSSQGGHKWVAWVTCNSRRCPVTPQMGIVQEGCENTKAFKQKAVELWNRRTNTKGKKP